MKRMSRLLAVSLTLVAFFSVSCFSPATATLKKATANAASSQNVSQKKKSDSNKGTAKVTKSEKNNKSQAKKQTKSDKKNASTTKKADPVKSHAKTDTKTKKEPPKTPVQVPTQTTESKDVSSEETQNVKTTPDDWKIVVDDDKSSGLFESIQNNPSVIDSLDDGHFLLVVGIILVVVAVVGIAYFCYLLFFKKRYVGAHFKNK